MSPVAARAAKGLPPHHGIPGPLSAEVADRWVMFRQTAARARLIPPHNPDFLRALLRVWASSDFVAHSCIAHPELLNELCDSGDLLGDYAPGEMDSRAAGVCGSAGDMETLGQVLRRFRRHEMVRIAWRDLAGWAPVDEVLRDLSNLATACIRAALDRLYPWVCKEMGTPKKSGGSLQQLVVLAMGKLGAGELNFSSDIDLIFAYPEDGTTRGRSRTSHQEFFNVLARRLIHVLADTTADGFVFRVDMRLRPYGESGPLTASFAFLEEYYESQGREWERYALIKAKPLTGEAADRECLMNLLRPFVYRRYLDFGAIEALRELKQRLEAEVRRKGMENDIKLGAGGIREVEFIAQSFQLIRGGRAKALQRRGLLGVLETLAGLRQLPPGDVERLAAAYRFLRRVENRLQAYADRQTHRLPATEPARLRLAFAMGYPDWEAFSTALQEHREVVQAQFAQVFATPQRRGGPRQESPVTELAGVWLGVTPAAEAEQVLAKRGFEEPAAMVILLEHFREGYLRRSLGQRARDRLDELVPLVLDAAAQSGSPGETTGRLVRLLEAIAGRSAYLALLLERPVVLTQLVRLCDASAWIADLLSQHPLLLDELIDPRTLYEPLQPAAFRHLVASRLDSVAAGDLEEQMEVLRQQQQSAVLQTAAAEVAGVIATMDASRQLTDIAEVLLQEVLQLAWGHLVERHGQPRCGRGRQRRDAGFAVAAYGKLGGRELGYGSDLDLVFLHDSDGSSQRTDGRKPMDNTVFFIRLGQRIVHLVNTQTVGGVLYELDMRLRPSGASGLLVSSLASFEEYQREDAWTWEHQALVRARVVTGSEAVAARFDAIRSAILRRRRDPGKLRGEVRDMRERMRQELAAGTAGRFDLKQDRGGVADIEFMVQYGVLLWSHDHPELLDHTDNIGLLAAFESAGVMRPEQARQLGDIYRDYLSRLHELALAEQDAVIDGSEFREHRGAVGTIWRELMEN